MSFAHLHTHTEYSLLDGSNKIKEYVKRIKELGMTGAAITDHGVMYGVVDFYKCAKKEGINPVLGCEVYVSVGSRFDKSAGKGEEKYYHLILLAENNLGYQNLMKIVSVGFTEGFYFKPRVDFEVLQEYHEGLICLSACLAGEVARALGDGNYALAKEVALRYRDLFGPDNYFLEIQDHGIPLQHTVNAGLMRLSQETGIELVATNDCHYTFAEDADPHDVLLCIQTGKLLKDEDRMRYSGGQYYVKSEEEMRGLFPYAPQAIDNAARIAERCHVELEFGVTKIPSFEVEEGLTPYDYLLKLCNEGIPRRYPNATPEQIANIKSRLDFELNTIKTMGYVEYFLIVWDFINYARENGIPVGPGRGSAAGSIVAYLVGITDIDPLKYSLLFERFLNPERVSMPDIDVDFCYYRRGEVIDYVVKKYGAECVCQIITFGTMAARGVIRDVGRVMDLPYQFVANVAKNIPSQLGITIDLALSINPELSAMYKEDAQVKELIDTAKRLEGLPRHSSMHAAGVVISKEPMVEYVPLARGSDGSVVTQFPMTTIEELGLLKMDFLGLRTLTVISDCLKMIRENTGDAPDFSNMDYDDSRVYSLISSGRTEGIFQLESGGMRSFMKELSPENFEDIIAGIALYRPGPMDFIPQYIKGKNNREAITYETPQLEPILSTTYGCIVYQEQVMEIVRSLAGYSLGRSDILRRAMSKKKADVMKREKEVFLYGDDEEGVKGCIQNGIDEKVAGHIYDEMMDFAKYAFNKSHAASYAVLSYQTAYLKYHYPREFFAALITSVIDQTAKVTEYIACLREMGIEVMPPDINSSDGRFTVKEGKVLFGMYGIKSVGRQVIDAIVSEREKNGKFTDLEEFIGRMSRLKRDEGNTNTSVLNKKAMECLILAGACDCLEGNRRQKSIVYSGAMDAAAKKGKEDMAGQISLFDIAGVEERRKFSMKFPDVEEFSKNELLAYEKEMMGIYVSGHPLEDYMELMSKNITATSEMFKAASEANLEETDIESVESLSNTGSTEELKDNYTYVVGGLITSINTRYTKNNQAMAILNLEDLKGTIEVVVFPKTYEKAKQAGILNVDEKVFIKGRSSIDGERQAKLLSDEIISFDDVPGKLFIKFANVPEFDKHKKELSDFLSQNRGRDSVVVYIESINSKKQLRYNVDAKSGLMAVLQEKYGDENIKLVKGKI